MGVSPSEIQRRLKATHLESSEEDLKEAIELATSGGKPETPVGDDPKDKEEYVFTLDWTDSRGKHWGGQFTNKILDINEQGQRDVLQASIQGGLPFEAFSRFAQDRNLAVAHMTYSLIKRPKWAKDLRKLKDPELILAIYEEVVAHEVTFWRQAKDQEEGGEAKPDDPDGA